MHVTGHEYMLDERPTILCSASVSRGQNTRRFRPPGCFCKWRSLGCSHLFDWEPLKWQLEVHVKIPFRLGSSHGDKLVGFIRVIAMHCQHFAVRDVGCCQSPMDSDCDELHLGSEAKVRSHSTQEAFILLQILLLTSEPHARLQRQPITCST